ncbi:MAG TPA: alpha/beta hydrolase [Longilinea sp.]|nr:alpha/beta hydrolase [Longilinea sp.]
MSTQLIIVIIFIAVVLIFVAASLYFYNLAISTHRKPFLADNDDLVDMGDQWKEDEAWFDAQPWQELTQVSYDGLKLNAYFLKTKKPTKRYAVLCHGYTSCAKWTAGIGRLFHDKMGYNILMPDDRGHGGSEGSYIGFGWHDRLDIIAWVKQLIAREGADIEIVLHGISMGGATVCMVSGEELPPQVKAIVSDCAYTTVQAEVSYQIKRMYKLPAFPLVHLTSLVCRLRAGYSFEEASAVAQVAKAKVPILFIHGGEDTFVPSFMVHELYNHCTSPNDLFLVPTAGHGAAYNVDPMGYEQKIEEFIAKHTFM